MSATYDHTRKAVIGDIASGPGWSAGPWVLVESKGIDHCFKNTTTGEVGHFTKHPGFYVRRATAEERAAVGLPFVEPVEPGADDWITHLRRKV